jgi:hypothetical protein
MHVNARMIPIETIPEAGRERVKENDGGGEFNYDILATMICCKNFCKYHNVPQSNNNKINK